ncbi:hypothetical protein AVEN_228158-1 [Araneus ventricosus]|uniref:Uncharacterized protein n=1 Tax=Araneus ventricosus TaxID=182803 RepID=A0A4Y2CV13_ARAVE|nr:hypothetical protein AVEN_228158-1 [Araneus ventricosus]
MWMRSRRISKRVLAPGRGYSNGGMSPSSINSMFLLKEGSGRDQRWLLGLRPQCSSTIAAYRAIAVAVIQFYPDVTVGGVTQFSYYTS